MRVLFAHDGFVSEKNKEFYSEVYNNKIINRYKYLAQEVRFLVRRGSYSTKENNKLEVIDFSVASIRNFRNINSLNSFSTAVRTVKQEVKNADYVVARIPSDLGFLAAHYAHKYDVPYIIEVVGCPWDSLRNHSLIGKVISPVYFILQKIAVSKSSYVIYVTNEFLQERYKTKGKFLGCSDVELNNMTTEVIEKKLNSLSKKNSNSPIVLASLGALDMKYKGYNIVIEAIASLKEMGLIFKYQIAGHGDPSWIKELIMEKEISDLVEIIPPMKHGEVFDWFKDVDVYIQPSLTEGMPRALIEAMSRGCPCIGSDAGGIPELLDEEMVFSKGNKNELIRILKELDTGNLIKYAKQNFEKSSEFDERILNMKRKKFYDDFKVEN